MTTIKTFVSTHSVPAYFALAFAISWGGVLVVIGGPGAIPSTAGQSDPLIPFVLLAMLAGPSVAGILLTGLVHGSAGFRECLSRLVTWRVGARWYAVALLTAPFVATALLLALSLLSPEFLPGIFTANDTATLLLSGLAVGLVAGVFEELGWTGFAVPELRLRYGIGTTGFIVGMLWGAWHFLVVVWGIGSGSGALPIALFVPLALFCVLPAFRVLMVWVYDHTGSLLMGILMHWSLTASSLILTPQATGVLLQAYDLVWVAPWVVAAAK